MSMAQFVQQHPVNHFPLGSHFGDCFGPGMPSAVPDDPLADVIHPEAGQGTVIGGEQLVLAIQVPFDRLNDQGPLGFRDAGLAQGEHDPVAGLAQDIALRLQELEALTGRGGLGAKKYRV